MSQALDMNRIVGSHDILFLVLDTLRYDVAAECLAAGRGISLPVFGTG